MDNLVNCIVESKFENNGQVIINDHIMSSRLTHVTLSSKRLRHELDILMDIFYSNVSADNFDRKN